MTINKRKILQSAQKHLQRGALDKALKDYQTLLEADPGDANLRLKLGEIHLRRGETREAVAAYLRVAAQFMKDGFDAKSVAIYKQINKIDPERQEVHEPLAELYQRMGLLSEAMGALQNAADVHQRAGRKRDSLDLLRKMAGLDPTNTTSRLKLAELLQHAGLDEEAATEFREAAAELERQGDPEGMAGALEKLLRLAPDDAFALERMAAAQLASQRPDRAEPFARRLVELDPDKPSGYEMLARVYQAMQRHEPLPDLYRRLAEAHRRRGDEDQARSILQRFVPAEPFDHNGIEPAFAAPPELGQDFEARLEFDERDLSGPDLGEDLFASEGAAALGSLEETTFVHAQPMLPSEPGHDVEPLPSLDRASGPAAVDPAPEGDPEQLLAEASVYLRYAKHDRAIACLEALLGQDERHRAALEKLGEAYRALGNQERAVDAWVRAAQTAHADGDTSAYEQLRDRIAALDERAVQALPRVGTAVAVRKPDETPDLLQELCFSEAHQPTGFEAVREQCGPDSPEQTGPDAMDDPIEIELDASAELTPLPGAPPPGGCPAPTARESGGVSHLRIAEQLEEASFYREQGMLEEAEEICRRVLSVIPAHPQAQLQLDEIAAARELCPGGTAPAPAGPWPNLDDETPDPFGDVDLDVEFGKTEAGSPASQAPGTDSTSAGGRFGRGTGIGAMGHDAADAEASPAQAAPGTTGEAEGRAGRAETGERDLAALDHAGGPDEIEPRGEAGGFDLAQALSDAFGEETGGSVATAEEGFQALFRDFKRGIEQTLGTEDAEVRYDLGIAYREMGLMEDALAEFEEARGAPGRRLDALHMMALCSLDLSRPAEAATRLEEALALDGTAATQRAALRFDLGRAREALGETAQALAAYREVARLEPDFPGVTERIDALGGGARPATAAAGGGFESFDELFSQAGGDSDPLSGPTRAPGDAELAGGEAAQRQATEGERLPAEGEPEPPSRPRRKRKISFL